MTVISDATVRNGRLYFPNKESLQHHYYEMKDAQDEVLANFALKIPSEFKVLMYGIVKRNGQWHGSKINTGL